MKKIITVIVLLVGMTASAQTFDFSCGDSVSFTELDGVWSIPDCTYTYSLSIESIANKTVWQVVYNNVIKNNYLASTEEKAHKEAQKQIKNLCEN